MPLPIARRTVLALAIVALFQVVLPLASTGIMQVVFHYPIRTVYYHGVFLLLANAAFLALALAAAAVLPRRTVLWRVIFGGWSLGVVALYLIHALAWIGSLFGGQPFFFAEALPYLTNPALLAAFASPLLVWTGLAGIPAAIVLCYLLAAPALGELSADLLSRLRSRALRESLARRRLVLASAALPVLAGAAVLEHVWPIAQWPASYVEPVVAVLGLNPIQIPIRGPGAESEAEAARYVVPERFDRKNVVLIVVDAMRPDHFGFAGYPRPLTPHLDALRASGRLQVAPSTLAGSTCTFGGLMTILRGKDIFHIETRSFALHEVLKKAGYTTYFLLGGDHTHYGSLRHYFGPGVDHFSDALLRPGYELNDDRGVLAALRDVPAYSGQPAFFYLHLMSVHETGIREPGNELYQPASGALGDREAFTNHFDNGLHQVDAFIQDALDTLAAKGYLADSLVIITADHGQSLGEKGVYGHAKNLAREELAIPVMFLDSAPVPHLDTLRQKDIAPTILGRLGLPVPPSWDGVSLYAGPAGPVAYHQLLDHYGITRTISPASRLKYTYDANRHREELYDIAADPAEADNLITRIPPQELDAFRQELRRFGIQPPTRPPRPDGE